MEKVKLFQDVENFVEELAKQGGKPLYELTPEEARQVLLDVQKTETHFPEVESEMVEIEGNEGRKLKLLIVKPKGLTGNIGVIYYIHGGGWVMGDEATHRRLISELAVDVPAGVVFPIYKQAPEGQYPEVVEDLYAGLKYIAKHSAQYGLDAAHLAVAGDSVGGNMATVLAMIAKENNYTPSICFQLLLYPVTNAAMDSLSYEVFAEGPWLTKMAMEWFWDMYLPEKSRRAEPYASPLRATKEQLQGLPPALVITDENDVLRDEGEAYAKKLDEAGVHTMSVRFNGTIHDFMVLNALSDTAPTRAAVSLAKAKLRWNLYGTK